MFLLSSSYSYSEFFTFSFFFLFVEMVTSGVPVEAFMDGVPYTVRTYTDSIDNKLILMAVGFI